MTYYIMKKDNELIGAGQCRCLNDGIRNIEVSEKIYNEFVEDKDRYIWNGSAIVINPDYAEIKARKERERLDHLTLTPSDVERALLAKKGWDFDDLKAYLREQGYTDIQIKAIGVELRAKDFYRGAVLRGTTIRIVDTIGALLGYSSDDMDYLFENGELPE